MTTYTITIAIIAAADITTQANTAPGCFRMRSITVMKRVFVPARLIVRMVGDMTFPRHTAFRTRALATTHITLTWVNTITTSAKVSNADTKMDTIAAIDTAHIQMEGTASSVQ